MKSTCVCPHLHFKAFKSAYGLVAGGLEGAPVRGHSYPAHQLRLAAAAPGDVGLAGRRGIKIVFI